MGDAGSRLHPRELGRFEFSGTRSAITMGVVTSGGFVFSEHTVHTGRGGESTSDYAETLYMRYCDAIRR